LFLVWGLLIMQWEMYTPFYASVLMFALSFLHKETMMTPKKILATMATVGQMVTQTMAVMIPIAFIISGLTVSGTASSFTAGLVTLGGGNALLILLLGAVACYILGMAGMMISAYIFLAVTLAPAVIQLGLNAIAVHLFILYYVMLSCITPPVAISAFVGAAIAGAEPMKTALTSMRLGIVVYFIPFFFVYNPILILQGGSLPELVYRFIMALVGVGLLGAGLEGYMWKVGKLHWLIRAFLFSAGLLILFPEKYSDILGGAVAIGALVMASYMKKRKSTAVDVKGPAE